MSAAPRRLFARPTGADRAWTLAALRDETTGGLLLLLAAVLALVWANSPWGDAYQSLAQTSIGPVDLHLNLTVAEWSADGLLAIFFFVAGLELRHELQLGTLSRPAQALVPIAAAIGGMVVPAVIYVAVNLAADGAPVGWGIPMATDIAFALAVLAVVGRGLPTALRAFLLSLAVVDDLGAIAVIAMFYSEHFSPGSFALACLAIAGYAVLQWRRVPGWWWYLALALLAWYFMHASGVHATIAGVAAGLLTRVRPDPGQTRSAAERAEHVVRPISAGIAVPVFAFFAAGVDLRGADLAATASNPVAVGVLLALVLGKPIGVLGTAAIMARFTRASLSEDIGWRDVAAVGMLAGIGFTVSLLIAELSFADAPQDLTAAKIAVLAASALSALLAGAVLVSRNRHYAAR